MDTTKLLEIAKKYGGQIQQLGPTNADIQNTLAPEETTGVLGTLGRFTGTEALGRFLGSKLASLDPATKANLEAVKKSGAIDEAGVTNFSRGGVSNRELAGSVAQTALSLGTVGMGKVLSSGSLAEKALKGATLGGAFGAAGAAQTEGSSIAMGALTGALIGGAIPIAGRMISDIGKGAADVPEKLYAQIFRRVEDDYAASIKSGYYMDLQKSNPEKYAQLLEKGLVPEAPNFNPTLAKEALNKGLRGNVENMAKYSFGKQIQIEDEIRDLVKGQVVKVDNKKGYVKLLTSLQKEFGKQDVGFMPERGKTANMLLSELKSAKSNKVSAETALKLRRFLDSMRNTSSFRTNPNLTLKQDAFKSAADKLRGALATQLPGIKDKMNDYRIFIEAFDELVKKGVRDENAKLLNMTDVLIGGGGLASGFPGAGIGAATAVRAFQSPTSLTGLGYGLNKVVGGVRSLSNALTSPGVRTAARTLTTSGIAATQ